MRGSDFMELRAFELVARRKSFSKAAEDVGISRSAISQTIKNLEQRLGVRLLNRTTRSVALTDAGYELLIKLSPAMLELISAVDNIDKFRDAPGGNLRIVACRLGSHLYLERMIGKFTERYPNITLDISTNDEALDLISHGFDAAIREEGLIDMDFIAMKLPEICHLSLIASPGYLEQHGVPVKSEDFEGHRCINVHRFGHGHLKSWELIADQNYLSINLHNPMAFNDYELALAATLEGAGICLIPNTYIKSHLKLGRLVKVLPQWCARVPSFRLCYPKLSHKTVALTVFSDFIRDQ